MYPGGSSSGAMVVVRPTTVANKITTRFKNYILYYFLLNEFANARRACLCSSCFTALCSAMQILLASNSALAAALFFFLLFPFWLA